MIIPLERNLLPLTMNFGLPSLDTFELLKVSPKMPQLHTDVSKNGMFQDCTTSDDLYQFIISVLRQTHADPDLCVLPLIEFELLGGYLKVLSSYLHKNFDYKKSRRQGSLCYAVAVNDLLARLHINCMTDPMLKSKALSRIAHQALLNVDDLTQFPLLRFMRFHASSHPLMSDYFNHRLPKGFEFFVWSEPVMELLLHLDIRYQAGIPLILEGETGDGKTELIKFWCALRKYRLFQRTIHGGFNSERVTSTVLDIVQQSIDHYRINREKTVILLDKMNASPAIDLLKEAVCDCRLNGQTLREGGHQVFTMIGCINPYRKRSELEIKRTRHLGLQVLSQEVKQDQNLADLIYRVHKLPPSLELLKLVFPSMSVNLLRTVIRKILMNSKGMLKCSTDSISCETLVLFTTEIHLWMQGNPKSDYKFVSFRNVEHTATIFKFFRDKIRPALLNAGETDNSERDCAVVAVSVSYIAKLGTAREDLYKDMLEEHGGRVCLTLQKLHQNTTTSIDSYQNTPYLCSQLSSERKYFYATNWHFSWNTNLYNWPPRWFKDSF